MDPIHPTSLPVPQPASHDRPPNTSPTLGRHRGGHTPAQPSLLGRGGTHAALPWTLPFPTPRVGSSTASRGQRQVEEGNAQWVEPLYVVSWGKLQLSSSHDTHPTRHFDVKKLAHLCCLRILQMHDFSNSSGGRGLGKWKSFPGAAQEAHGCGRSQMISSESLFTPAPH